MDPFIAEIRMFPFNFAPKGWAWCDGQLLPISQNTALFSLLGTTYGGDGKVNFGLPDLEGSAPLGQGQGETGKSYYLGDSAGASTITLIVTEMPAHSHSLNATVEDGTQGSLTQGVTIASSGGGTLYQKNTSGLQAMNQACLPFIGNNEPHQNMMPFLTLYFNIALQGVYPPRD